jgi:hypothetical protein
LGRLEILAVLSVLQRLDISQWRESLEFLEIVRCLPRLVRNRFSLIYENNTVVNNYNKIKIPKK